MSQLKTNVEPLPPDWVDVIFSKLSLTYGRDFLGRYEGQDLHAVKADWADRLSGLQYRPDAIKYALGIQGAKAPNVIEFKEACNRAPVRAMLAIEPPKANPDVIESAIAKAREATRFRGDRLDPIRRLRQRDLDRDKTLTRFQREFWRIALKKELEIQQ